jgi:mannose-1-phosphate guanylyltransferase
MKFVIRAGGVGTRLWPFSRSQRPKQFHAMAGDRTMLQEAVERIDSIAAPDDIFVSTGTAMTGLVREQLPKLPADHLIIEPALRNTGPAIGLECALMEARFPGCTVASLGSDHFVGRQDEFCRLLRVAEEAIRSHADQLLVMGAKPTRPETGYGYIRKGSEFGKFMGEPVYRVEQFAEKPDEPRARAYLESGQYLWNINMFVWKAATMLELIASFEPQMHEVLMRIKEAAQLGREAEIIATEYPQLTAGAIDTQVIERTDRVVALEAVMNWGDIGSWAALADVLPTDEEGNLISGEAVKLDAKNNIVYGPKGKLLALIGVEDLVVVDTEDALLVCARSQSQRVKEVMDELKKNAGHDRYT